MITLNSVIRIVFRGARVSGEPVFICHCAIVSGLVNLILIGTVHAFDFSYVPLARASMRADDNIRGTLRNPEAAWGFDMGGGVTLRAQNETFKSELAPSVNLRRFAIGKNLDADEYSVAFNNDWTQARYTTGLHFSYDRDSTLTTAATDTGIRNDVTDRDSIQIQPVASWYATDRLSFQGSFLFNDVSYLNAVSTGFIDYRYLQGSAGATYLWRENLQVFANFFVSEFATPSEDSTTRSYGGQTGASWSWDETLDFTAAMGWIYSNFDFVNRQAVLSFVPLPLHFEVLSTPATASAGGPIASATIRKSFETVTTRLDYSRDVSPSGRGAQSTGDRITGMVEKFLSRQLSVALDGLYQQRAAETQGVIADARALSLNHEYAELRGTVRYRIAPEWKLSAVYRFGHSISTDSTSPSIDGHGLYFTVEYNGLPQTFWNGF